MIRKRRTLAEIEQDKINLCSGVRVCRKCKSTKALAEFRQHRYGDGYTTWCKYCLDINSESYRQSALDFRKEQARVRRLKCVYGITPEQYSELLQKQNGLCAICLKSTKEFSKNLAVDHDHKSGEIRGLLCTNCNHRLVARHRDGALLRRIADYVEQGTGWYVPSRSKKKTKARRKLNGDW